MTPEEPNEEEGGRDRPIDEKKASRCDHKSTQLELKQGLKLCVVICTHTHTHIPSHHQWHTV